MEKPVPIAIKVTDTPPAELLACADRPAPFPTDAAAWAVLPARIRAQFIALASSFRTNADRLDRLVNWSAAGSCPTAVPETVK